MGKECGMENGKTGGGGGGNVDSYQGGDFGDQAKSSKVGCQMKRAFSVHHFRITFYFTFFFFTQVRSSIRKVYI